MKFIILSNLILIKNLNYLPINRIWSVCMPWVACMLLANPFRWGRLLIVI